MQPDTIIPDLSNPQGWNRYSYVNNRPVNFNDPTGHCLGLTACFVEVAKAGYFLGRRALTNGTLTNDDFVDAANYAAPAIASGSKESVSQTRCAFVCDVKSTTLITTKDGYVQFYKEKGIGGSLLGWTYSATHGLVSGLTAEKGGNPALKYHGPAIQANASVNVVAEVAGPVLEGYTSPDLKIKGVDYGISLGPSIAYVSAAKTHAEETDTIFGDKVSVKSLNGKLSGPGLLICRLVSMCGAK